MDVNVLGPPGKREVWCNRKTFGLAPAVGTRLWILSRAPLCRTGLQGGKCRADPAGSLPVGWLADFNTHVQSLGSS